MVNEYKELTVGELRKVLEGVPDELHIRLSSDTGVDQGIDGGKIVIENAGRVRYQISDEIIDYFEIYANEREIDEEEDEEDL